MGPMSADSAGTKWPIKARYATRPVAAAREQGCRRLEAGQTSRRRERKRERERGKDFSARLYVRALYLYLVCGGGLADCFEVDALAAVVWPSNDAHGEVVGSDLARQNIQCNSKH